MMSDKELGIPVESLVGRQRRARDVAMNPFHRIGRRERQRSRQHLIEGNAERIEVAARID